MAQEWLGDSSQIHFIAREQSTHLLCRLSQPTRPAVTQQVLIQGPRGHDLVRKEQLSPPEIGCHYPSPNCKKVSAPPCPPPAYFSSFPPSPSSEYPETKP